MTWRERREAARQKWRDNPQMLEWIHVSAFGWWTDDPARLELALDEFYRPVEELIASDAILRVSLEGRFQRVRVGFQSFDLKILAAPDREFLIGDAPVLAMREGHGGLGIFDGVGLATLGPAGHQLIDRGCPGPHLPGLVFGPADRGCPGA